MKLKIAGLALALSVVATSAGAVVPITPVTSFEGSGVPAAGYGYSIDENGKAFAAPFATSYTALLTGVTFTGMSGIQSNGSAWGFPAAPDGTATAFLQSYRGSQFGQQTNGSITVDLGGALVANRGYDLVFYTAGRPSGSTQFTVSYDGGKATTFAAPATAGFGKEVFSFKASGGQQSITFTALDGQGDDTAFALDNIGISAPEPATWAMMLVGFGGLGAALRMNRRRVTAVA
jgi:hypothetical protein